MNRKARRDTRPTPLEQALSAVRRAYRMAESPVKADFLAARMLIAKGLGR